MFLLGPVPICSRGHVTVSLSIRRNQRRGAEYFLSYSYFTVGAQLVFIFFSRLFKKLYRGNASVLSETFATNAISDPSLHISATSQPGEPFINMRTRVASAVLSHGVRSWTLVKAA